MQSLALVEKGIVAKNRKTVANLNRTWIFTVNEQMEENDCFWLIKALQKWIRKPKNRVLSSKTWFELKIELKTW